MAQSNEVSRAHMSPPTDAELESRVWDVLHEDSRVDPTEVAVHVESGVIHLTGMVDSAAERKAALEDAETIADSSKIVDRMSLKNFVQRTNEELTEEVRHAMKRCLDVETDDVVVEAADGLVTVLGRVESFAHKHAVENLVWWTPGVTDVISRLQVDGVEEPPDEPDY